MQGQGRQTDANSQIWRFCHHGHRSLANLEAGACAPPTRRRTPACRRPVPPAMVSRLGRLVPEYCDCPDPIWVRRASAVAIRAHGFGSLGLQTTDSRHACAKPRQAETPTVDSGHATGATTLGCTRMPSHERREGSVAFVAAVAAEKVEDSQRRSGREEQLRRRLGLGRAIVVRWPLY